MEPPPPELLEPPPVSDLLPEPHAATVRASTRAAASASQVREFKELFSLVVFVTAPRLPSLGAESVTGVWTPCEKPVKVPGGSDSRIRSGYGCTLRPGAPPRALPAACGRRRRRSAPPCGMAAPRRRHRAPRD